MHSQQSAFDETIVAHPVYYTYIPRLAGSETLDGPAGQSAASPVTGS
jgi:hypothetical protein